MAGLDHLNHLRLDITSAEMPVGDHGHSLKSRRCAHSNGLRSQVHALLRAVLDALDLLQLDLLILLGWPLRPEDDRSAATLRAEGKTMGGKGWGGDCHCQPRRVAL